MLYFLTIILCLAFVASAIIMSKYIDFAMFMIERKNKDIEPRVIQFNHPRPFKKRQQQDIIIDIPVKDVKVLNNSD